MFNVVNVNLYVHIIFSQKFNWKPLFLLHFVYVKVHVVMWSVFCRCTKGSFGKGKVKPFYDKFFGQLFHSWTSGHPTGHPLLLNFVWFGIMPKSRLLEEHFLRHSYTRITLIWWILLCPNFKRKTLLLFREFSN